MQYRNPLFIASLGLFLVACQSSSTVQTPDGNVMTQTSSLPSLEETQVDAAKGDRAAQFMLGAHYQEGDGVPKDLNKAREWFEKAAAQGEPRAQFNLGVMYYNGESVTKNLGTAFDYFSKAAASDNPRAQFNLGVMYYRGESTQKDLAKAFDYFSKAANQGMSDAQFNLGVMYAKGENVEANPVEAYAWFTLASEGGDQKAVGLLEGAKPKMTKQQLDQAVKRADQLRKQIKP